MHYIGVDIIEIPRIRQAISRWGEGFLHRVYTDLEFRLYRKKLPSLAARFAGKEAVIKAIGKETKGIGWREIEIVTDPDGKPAVYLHGRARSQAANLGLGRLNISLSHCREYAIAFVTAETG
ncbi:MAG: holo-ACP synthase [Chloroflexota bacterium]|nr:holo-ACP synthase [Chloroflexota bacterium]